jgi:hypothetical protein
MISQLKLEEQDVWEAWIEFDHHNPDLFGMLYISGEFAAIPGSHRIQNKIVETEYGTQLLIQLPPRPVGRSRMKELFYSEPVKQPGQYDSICVYSGTELLARFSQIETLV